MASLQEAAAVKLTLKRSIASGKLAELLGPLCESALQPNNRVSLVVVQRICTERPCAPYRNRLGAFAGNWVAVEDRFDCQECNLMMASGFSPAAKVYGWSLVHDAVGLSLPKVLLRLILPVPSLPHVIEARKRRGKRGASSPAAPNESRPRAQGPGQLAARERWETDALTERDATSFGLRPPRVLRVAPPAPRGVWSPEFCSAVFDPGTVLHGTSQRWALRRTRLGGSLARATRVATVRRNHDLRMAPCPGGDCRV